MRLPLLIAVGAALAATSAPANAAYYPVCATHLELAEAGVTSSCRSGNTPMLTRRMQRIVNVAAVTGTATASVTCFNYPYANTTASRTVRAGERAQFSVVERGGSCVTELTAATRGTTAAATSTFSVLIEPEPTV